MQLQKIITFSVVLTLASCSSINSNKGSNTNSELTTTNLLELDFQKDYTLTNAEYGTKTIVSIKAGNRLMETNALPNHATGAFPNEGNPNTISAQDKEYSFPIKPAFSGESKWAREPGVALNGVKFESETAERFVCETGEVYRIEAFQELVDLGLDFNHAHVQPTGAYHYHGIPVELMKALDRGEDLILVGYALDGFQIYYSKSGKYKPSFQLTKDLRTGDACSYGNPKHGMDKELNETQADGTFVSDWEYVVCLGQLDECNGIEVNGQYGYFVTEEYPYLGRCLKGVFKEERRPGPPPDGRRGEHPHGGGHPPHRH
jgi:hypothetical protein